MPHESRPAFPYVLRRGTRERFIRILPCRVIRKQREWDSWMPWTALKESAIALPVKARNRHRGRGEKSACPSRLDGSRESVLQPEAVPVHESRSGFHRKHTVSCQVG